MFQKRKKKKEAKQNKTKKKHPIKRYKSALKTCQTPSFVATAKDVAQLY